MKRVPSSALRLGPTLSALALGLAAVALPGAASASQTFPGAIMEYLDATGDAPPCAPTCTLCHASPAGGVDTVRSAGFVDNMRGQSTVAYHARMDKPPRPLTALDPSTVGPALAALEKLPCANTMTATPCDSDGDGIGDVTELRAGTDPDRKNALLGECPQYGCGAKADSASIAPRGSRSREVPGAWLVAGLGMLVFARRRRTAPVSEVPRT